MKKRKQKETYIVFSERKYFHNDYYSKIKKVGSWVVLGQGNGNIRNAYEYRRMSYLSIRVGCKEDDDKTVNFETIVKE